MKLIECVPNFSEGKQTNVINQITDAIKETEGVTLLDVDPGKDTNRTVVTFIGSPEAVITAAYEAIKTASDLIDMRKHIGEHPRMGATDVCPFIPIANVTMDECVEYSKRLADKVSKDLNIPIYLYENSSNSDLRKSLSNIRSGQYEGMEEKIKLKEWIPDYGEPIFNKESGVTAIGAREFLIAYNINLNTQDKKKATDIALDIRETGRAKRDKDGKIIRDKNNNIIKKPGTLTYCKAVGWYIDEYNIAQVSINLTNYKKNSIHKTFEEVRKQARKRGLRVTGSEIVGLVPKKALIDCGIYYLMKQKKSTGIPENDIINIAIQSLGLNEISIFDKNKKIIENMIHEDNLYGNFSIKEFLDDISRETPTPGGGSVSALAASLGAALSSMVANLSYSKKGYEKNEMMLIRTSEICQQLLKESIIMIDKDSNSYNSVINAIRMPKKSKTDIKKRDTAIYSATKEAADSPLNILKLCNKMLKQTYKIAVHGNVNSLSDSAVANDMIYAGAKGAIYNILINIPDLSTKDQKQFKDNIDYYFKQIDDLHLKINKHVENILF